MLSPRPDAAPGTQHPALADLLPAVIGALGVTLPDPSVPGWDAAAGRSAIQERLGSGMRHAIVVLIDGLGEAQLLAHRDLAPNLDALRDIGPIRAPFPSSTPVSLASLGTGLPAGMHGIIGTTFRIDAGRALAPLSWREDPNPVALQPEPTIFEQAEARGISVVTVAPSQHRSSGLTRAVLRGGVYAGSDTFRSRVDSTAMSLRMARSQGQPSLTHVYWPELDKAGHYFGVDSAQYREQLRRIDEFVAELAALAGDDVTLLATADHGLVDIADAGRFDLEADATLRLGVETILGEPRARHIYCQAGRAEQVELRWRERLAERALVLSRADAQPLFGPVDPWHLDRIGDVVAIAGPGVALVSERIDRIVSGLRGQHGGTTPEEVFVPLRAAW